MAVTYYAYDPRESIRQAIGTSKWNFAQGVTSYYAVLTDDDGEAVNLPIYLSEETQVESLPEMPFIEMHLAHTTYSPHNPAATIREMRAYVDMFIYFTNLDYITPVTLMKNINNYLQDRVRVNQSGVTGTWFFHITDERHQKEVEGKQVQFTCILTMECIWTDAC